MQALVEDPDVQDLNTVSGRDKESNLRPQVHCCSLLLLMAGV